MHPAWKVYFPDPAARLLHVAGCRLPQRPHARMQVSLWPDVEPGSASYATLTQAKCLVVGGRTASTRVRGWAATVDPTSKRCRDLIWDKYMLPNYVEHGVRTFWLDETEMQSGMETSLGPAGAYGNYWPNAWMQLMSDGLTTSGVDSPVILTRAVWAGAARLGGVLWSSDIWSTFEELAAQVPEGVAASLSGTPWWTTDVGGFGCPMAPHDNESPYMRELVVRWHQFGVFCPVYRTHGCRNGTKETLPPGSPCDVGQGPHGSCGANEVWSYGTDVERILTRLIRFRNDVLSDYISELARNVSLSGVPTLRPLWYEFPADPLAWLADETLFMLGPKFLVAPVVSFGQRQRVVYLPAGSAWADWEDPSQVHCAGPTGRNVSLAAPLEKLVALERLPSCPHRPCPLA